jgi:hypothetical protein
LPVARRALKRRGVSVVSCGAARSALCSEVGSQRGRGGAAARLLKRRGLFVVSSCGAARFAFRRENLLRQQSPQCLTILFTALDQTTKAVTRLLTRRLETGLKWGLFSGMS